MRTTYHKEEIIWFIFSGITLGMALATALLAIFGDCPKWLAWTYIALIVVTLLWNISMDRRGKK